MSTLAQVELILYCFFFLNFYIVRTESSPLAAALTFYRDLFVPAVVVPEPRRMGSDTDRWRKKGKKDGWTAGEGEE